MVLPGKRKYFSLYFLLIIGAYFLSAQNRMPGENAASLPIQLSIPSKASIYLAGSDLKFSFVPGKGTEQILTPKSVGKLWLNYSSLVERYSTNAICVSLSRNTLPAEILIRLKIGPDVGAGAGMVGKPSGSIILSTSPQPIVTNIGSCYTGLGVNKGHLLSFTWEMNPEYDPSDFVLDSLKIEAGVIYTIVSNE
jgi:hypothetical protein